MLSQEEARAFYDRFGAKQDWQRLYEGRAVQRLLAQGHFAQAEAVFEFGCGTGAFARGLLANYLPPEATYLGCDLSTTMVRLSRARLAPFGGRAQVCLTDGSVHLPAAGATVDRFIANYVLDLLPADEITALLAEAHRLLKPGGLACLVSLGHGVTPLSRLVAALWAWVHAQRPGLVGGCRPLALGDFITAEMWQVRYQETVVALGVPSEVVVARKRGG